MERTFSNGRCWLPPNLLGEAHLGGRLAVLGSDGLYVFTHSIHVVECAREVWAAWRAFFLPDSEGASDGGGY